jgi:predicted nucleic acid-binding Zn ribbon protein
MRGERAKICNIENTDTVRTMARDAFVTCGKCGAKAHDPVNVCDPVQLPEPGMYGD